MKFLEFLQKQITWALSILMVLISLITFLVSLNIRVSALEEQGQSFQDFIKDHIHQQNEQAVQLNGMQKSLDLITGYFKLTPR